MATNSTGQDNPQIGKVQWPRCDVCGAHAPYSLGTKTGQWFYACSRDHMVMQVQLSPDVMAELDEAFRYSVHERQ